MNQQYTEGLRCPNMIEVNGTKRSCESESIIHARIPGSTGKPVYSCYGICRKCWHKAPIQKFIDAYEIAHDEDGQKVWTPEGCYTN